MEPTRANFIKKLTELGGSFEEPHPPFYDGQSYDMNVDAPVGQVWAGDDLHCFVALGHTKPELWKDALDRMSMGVEPCTIKECDTCDG